MKYKERKVHIGDFVLNEPKEFTNSSYECAAWHQSIIVKPGKYPVYGDLLENDTIEDNSVYCTLTGNVSSSNFSSLFCGNMINSHIDENLGEKANYTFHPYAHALAWTIIRGNETNIKLFDRFEAKKIKFISYIDNKECETANIVARY